MILTTIILTLLYVAIAWLVGKAMWNLDFAGSKPTVRIVGGGMWPLTMWMVLAVVASEGTIKRTK